MLESVFKMAENPESVEVVLRVDEDDDATIASLNHLPDYGIKIVLGKSLTMGILNTECYGNATGDIIMLVNDDLVVKTRNWDRILKGAVSGFNDQIFLAYPNDLHKKESMATFPILHRKTLESLKEPFPKEYHRTYIDLHLMDIFKRVQHVLGDRIIYISDVIFEHYHPFSGKQFMDKTYHSRETHQDDVVFMNLSLERQNEALRLVARGEALPEFNTRAEMIESLSGFISEYLFNHQGSLIWRLKLISRITAKCFVRLVLAKK